MNTFTYDNLKQAQGTFMLVVRVDKSSKKDFPGAEKNLWRHHNVLSGPNISQIVCRSYTKRM